MLSVQGFVGFGDSSVVLGRFRTNRAGPRFKNRGPKEDQSKSVPPVLSPQMWFFFWVGVIIGGGRQRGKKNMEKNIVDRFLPTPQNTKLE